LKQLVNKFGPRNWKIISDKLITRSPVQCLHRWTKILQPGLKKGPWTIEEDNLLAEWVNKEGPCKWSLCGEFIKGRSGKQCRERWFNTLNPVVIKGSWTAKEDFLIFELFSKYGSRWSQITSHLKGRSENSIKNRFYSTLRRICAENKKMASNIDDCNKMNFYLSNLEELLKYVPQAHEEKKAKYKESLEDNEENDNIIEENNFLAKKRKPKDICSEESKKTNLLMDVNIPTKISKDSKEKSTIIKIQNQSFTNSNILLSKSNTNSYSNTNYSPLKTNIKPEPILNELNDISLDTYDNSLGFLFNKIKQLENRLKQAHTEIKRFDLISNAYSSIPQQEFNHAYSIMDKIQHLMKNNLNTVNVRETNVINNYSQKSQPMMSYNMLQLQNYTSSNNIMTNK
jgi:hypothetical protein